MNLQRKVDVQAFLDAQRFSRFHILLFVLCFLIIALDGMDTGAMGYIAPSLIQEWHLSRAALGPVLSATLVGIGIGAMVVSPFADRIGRKRVLIGSVFAFGVCSVAAAFAQSLEMLAALRLLTGIGLGAAVPNAVALMAEYAPTRIRGTVVNAMLVGFAAGNGLGGLMTAWLIPRFGWHGVLVVGGVAPVLLALVLVPLLPESVKFLVANRRSREDALGILGHLAPGARLGDVQLVCEEDAGHGRKSPLSELFRERYAVGTCLIWLCYFMCMVILYLVTSWLPTLFTTSGYSLQESTVTSSLFHLGGCAGILLAGFLTDRFPPTRVVAAYFLAAAVLVLVIGYSGAHAGLTTMIVIVGMAISGASASMSPLAAHYYPTTSRVTGIAWMLGMGRFGGVAGTMGGAWLLGIGWAFGAIFSLLAIPAVIAAICLLLLGRNGLPQEERELPGSAVAEH
jgi:AAHS family 4-hydroxybenzoate transporter-like MFS transporter